MMPTEPALGKSEVSRGAGRRLHLGRRERGRRSSRLSLESLEPRWMLSVQPISLANSAFYGSSGSGASSEPSLSADGQELAFTSSASNLITNDFNGFTNDVFVLDQGTGAVRLVSINAAGTSSGNGPSSRPIVSGDGRYVLFGSSATDLVAGVTYKSGFNLFRRDLQSGTTTVVSVDPIGSAVGFDQGSASISTDGRFIAFSAQNNLGLVASQPVPPPGQSHEDIYVRDMQTGTTALVSVNSDGSGGGNANSINPVISADGTFVAYYSDASNLVANDANQVTDVFARDLVHNQTILVSRSALGLGTGNQASPNYPSNTGRLAISPDGRFVAFVSLADDLIAGFHDGNGSNGADVFVRDTVAGTTTLVSVNAAGTASGNYGTGEFAGALTMSADGRSVAFQSGATDLIAGGSGGFVGSTQNVYLRDLTAGTTKLLSADRNGNGGGNNYSFSENPRISGDGRFVVFDSNAFNLVDNDNNSAGDVFVYDRTTGKTSLASVNSAGTGSGAGASPPSYDGYLGSKVALSTGGGWVAFVSFAGDLVAGDNNRAGDVVVRALPAGPTALASQRSAAMPQAYTPHGVSNDPSISADGRYVAFYSSASDVAANDANYPNGDVFVRDRDTGTTTLVSVNKDGTGTGNNQSYAPLISTDGRYVIFQSKADNLVANMPANPSGAGQLFRRDLQTGTTVLVSKDAAGTGVANGSIYAPTISPDGRFVAFTSPATNLVTGFTVGHANEIYGDLYVRDIQAGTTKLVSVDTTGHAGADADVTSAVISANGQVVVFVAAATNLVAGDTAAVANVFVRDLAAGVTKQLSSKPGGTVGTGYDPPDISDDGRYVAFTSAATDLVSIPDGNSTAAAGIDVFVADLQAGTTTLVSINAAGTASGDVDSGAPSISADGRYVAFQSYAGNLITGGTRKFPNVYVRDLQARTTTLVTVNAAGTGDASGYAPVISGNGRAVSFQSIATDVVSGFVNNNGDFSDIYVRNLLTGVTILATASTSGVGGQDNYVGSTGLLSADGGVAVFVTGASNLFEGDRNGATQTYTSNGVADVYAVTTAPGQGTIGGQVFNDANGNGTKDSGESGLAGWTVYLDANGNGRPDAGEPTAGSNAGGNYAFNGLAAGTYTVAIAPQANYQVTHPAAPGTYSVSLATDTSTASGKDFGEHQVFADLKTQSVTVTPASVAAGQSVAVSWTVKNQGQYAAAGSWADAVFLTRGSALDASATLLALVNHSGLAVGSSYTGQTSVAVPGLAPGSYRLIVQVDYRNQVPEGSNEGNNLVVSTPLTVTIPTLTPGTPLAGAFTAPGQAHYYQITATPGQSLAVALQSAANAGSVGLYIRRNELPTPYAYDYKPSNLFQPSQRVTVPVTQPGIYYVLAESLDGAAASGTFTITASLPGFAIQQIGVVQGGTGGQVTVPITGSNLTPGVQVKLVAGGRTITASAVDFRDATIVYATFNLAGAALGTYDVTATDGMRSATLAHSFQVVAAQRNPLQVTMSAPQFLRDNHPSPLVIDYTNTGNVDLVAPILQLSVDKAVLSLAGGPQFAGNTAQVLAIGSDGPAGILRPGESGRIVIEALGTSQVRHDQVSIQLGVAETAGPTAIDWSSMKDQLRPSYIQQDAWDVIWSNLTAAVGSSAAQYQEVLAADASALSRVGEATADPSQLLAFEIAQANNLLGGASLNQAGDIGLPTPGIPLLFGRTYLQPISGRYRLGPLGRGWAENWEISASADADGNVTLIQGGTVRLFTQQSDGTFTGTFGDPTSLTRVGGVYHLVDATNNTYVFRTDGSLDYVQDLNGNRVTAGYTGGRLASLTHSNGSWLHLTYNGQGRLTGVAASDGRSVTYTYDASGQHLVSAATPSGTTAYAYVTGQGAAREHALGQITLPSGVQETFSYDARGRLITTRYGTAASFTLSYPSPGQLDVAANGAPARSVFFDENAQPRMIRDPLGNTYQFQYDGSGNLIGALTPAGTSYSYSYDTHNNPTGQINPLGYGASVVYDDQTNQAVTVTDARGRVTTFGYDAKGNLTLVTYPDTTTEHYQYDAQGNITQSVNRRGQAVNYTYNVQGLVTREDFADGSNVTFAYDAKDNLTSVTDAGGTTTAQYDANGRLTKLTQPSGRFLQYTYDAAGRRIQTVDQTGFAVNYQYDANGRLSGLTDGASRAIVTYTYDAQGRLAKAQAGNGTYTTYAYDAAGNLLHLINYAPGGAVNSRFDSTYDSLGHRVSLTTLDGTTNYTYDATGQLIGTTLPGGRAITYAYDAAGNRISATDNGVTATYTSNSLNEYTAVGSTQYTYDADGNLVSETDASGTTAYTYDQRNRLTRIQAPQNDWAYQYDALGNITAITHNGVTTQEMTDPLTFNMLVAEYNGSGQLIAHYTYGNGLVSQVAASGAADYYNFDPTGSTVGISGGSGTYVNKYSYLPFGETTTLAAAVRNPFTFSGQYGVTADGSGLLHMQYRRYDPATGQFTTEDPLGFNGGDFNLRRYALNDPIGLADPSGLAWLAIQPFNIPFLPGGCCLIDMTEQGPFSQTNLELGHEHFFFTDGNGVAVPGTNNVVDNIGWGHRPGTGNDDPVGQFMAGENQANGYINRYWLDDDLLRQAIADVGVPGNGWHLTGYNCQQYAQDVVDAYRRRYWQQPPLVRTRIIVQSFAEILFGGDPNDIVGPAGYGPGNYLPPGRTLPYTINFMNDPKIATAAAQDVIITETLDPHVDATTFELGPIGFGPVRIDVPAGLQVYQTQVMYHNVDGSPLRVDITAGLNVATGVVTWTFRSVDPATGTFPTNAIAGFLPVDDATKVGEAYVSYFVKDKANLATGTAIHASASIVFDVNDPIATNTFVNTIDATSPTSSVAPLPATTTSLGFTVSWSGSDGAGSGIAAYDVYVSDNGGPFQAFQTGTTATSAVVNGQVGHTYRFYSVATDHLGFVQTTSGAAQAAITVVAHTPPPTPTPSLVTVIDVRLVLDRKHRVAQIIVSFSGLVDIGQANSLATYRLATAGKKGSFDAKNAKVVRLKSAAYDAANRVVVLRPKTPFAIRKTVQLRVNGLAPAGLRDGIGRLIDGNHDGLEGGNGIALLTRRGVTQSAVRAASAAALPALPLGAIDVLLDAGGLVPVRRRSRDSRP